MCTGEKGTFYGILKKEGDLFTLERAGDHTLYIMPGELSEWHADPDAVDKKLETFIGKSVIIEGIPAPGSSLFITSLDIKFNAADIANENLQHIRKAANSARSNNRKF